MARILEIEDLSFRYPDATRNAVSGFHLNANEGEIIVLAGPSGCGKSTLLRSVNGLIPHMYTGDYTGSVTVAGKKVGHTPMRELAQTVGFLFQNPENQIFMFTVERDVAFGLENLGIPRSEMRRRVDNAISVMGIESLAQRAPHELSDGQKQRVALAGVIAMSPRLVILDEPTSLLDPKTAAELVGFVAKLRRETGTSFLIVEHRLDLLVEVADRIVVMDRGSKVTEGTPSEVLFGDEADAHGVSVPAIVQVQRALSSKGIVSRERIMDPAGLAGAVEGKA